jgi:hypothetical protein
LTNGLFGTLLGKRRTVFLAAAKLPDSSRVVLWGQVRHYFLLPTHAARLTKVEAILGFQTMDSITCKPDRSAAPA